MKPIVFFILGVLAVLALGAFQAPPAPVRYRILDTRDLGLLENDMNELAGKGCRLHVAFALQTSVASAGTVAVMECPGE